MSEQTELAWCAGFFDGEGCTTLGGRAGGRRRLRVVISQREREVLDRFARAVGIGNTGGPYNYGQGSRYLYVVTGRNAETVVRAIWPYLGTVKRDQYRRCIEALSAQARGEVDVLPAQTRPR